VCSCFVQWRRSVVKSGRSGSVRSSHQTVSGSGFYENALYKFTFTYFYLLTPYVSDFQTLNNPGSWQLVGASKNQFYLPFLTRLSSSDVKLAELSNNSFRRKNVTDILGGQNILWPLLHIFMGPRHPAPRSTPLVLFVTRCICGCNKNGQSWCELRVCFIPFHSARPQSTRSCSINSVALFVAPLVRLTESGSFLPFSLRAAREYVLYFVTYVCRLSLNAVSGVS